MGLIPGRGIFPALGGVAAGGLLLLMAGVVQALLTGQPLPTVPDHGYYIYALCLLAALVVLLVADYGLTRRAWRRAAPAVARRLPAAFAIGVRSEVQLTLEARGTPWVFDLYDEADPSLVTEGLPVRVRLRPQQQTALTYYVTPTCRGEVAFGTAQVRVWSRLRFWELLAQAGPTDSRRVYPDFAQVARYAWLAGDRRLAEMGIKSWQRRGEGTDFKQLAEYRIGQAVRQIDWKATLRLDKPIIREYQDERDQFVMLLIDCGRRMRADDRQGNLGRTHFDQVLNAALLLTYVALRHGDAVGAMTFGTQAGAERFVRPRKGARALNEVMSELYAVQPTPTHSDYLAAARTLMSQQARRSLVIVITNFRDEDSTELAQALTLLRSRHLVLLASLRERVVEELASQELTSPDAVIEVASAHLYAQARRDAFLRLAARDALMVDADPERLAIELVNRYQAVKRASLI
jgi:uncharacterized protein (DUF58 family)